jgi:hypothetical protein
MHQHGWIRHAVRRPLTVLVQSRRSYFVALLLFKMEEHGGPTTIQMTEPASTVHRGSAAHRRLSLYACHALL